MLRILRHITLVIACVAVVACQSGFKPPQVATFPYMGANEAEALSAELATSSSTIHATYRQLNESSAWGTMPSWQQAAGLDTEEPFLHEVMKFSYQYLEDSPFGYYLKLDDVVDRGDGNRHDALLFINWPAMRRNLDSEYPYVDINQALRADYPGAPIAAALLHLNQFYSRAGEVNSTLSALERRAELGDKAAIGFLAVAYTFGMPRVEQDAAAAQRWTALGADLREPMSLHASGWRFNVGLGVTADREMAMDYFLQAAELGHHVAAYVLGSQLVEPDTSSQNIPAGMFWLRQAAGDGNLDAQALLGYIHKDDQLGFEDREQSNYWLSQAAVGGDSNAQLEMAFIYRDGIGVEPSRDGFLYWLHQSAVGGNAVAQSDLANEIIDWDGEVQNWTDAIPWLVRSADQGNLSAISNLAYMFYNGYGVELNYELALELYHRAAELGRPGGMYSVGLFYARGQAVEKDYETASEWFLKAIEAGNYPDAHAEMGYILWDTDRRAAVQYYINAANLGVEVARKRVIEWFSKGDYLDVSAADSVKWLKVGAEEGNSAAMRQLSMIFNAGVLVERNPEEFIRYGRMAAEAGDPQAQMAISLVYARGEDAPQDYAQMQYWLEQAVAQKYYPAYSMLAALLSGPLPPGDRHENYARAIELVEEAGAAGDARALTLKNAMSVMLSDNGGSADFEQLERAGGAGDMQAMTALAFAYYEGRGTEQNLAHAYTWGLQAAERGSGTAQYLVAIMLDSGEGAERDLVEAYKWMSVAARVGHPAAAAYLPDLADVMSPAELSIGERRALEWWEKQVPTPRIMP